MLLRLSKSKKQKKYFRLSEPGIGAAYLCGVDADSDEKIVMPKSLPKGCITLWLSLDHKSFILSKKLHAKDLRNRKYSRGLYDETFPEACILLEYEQAMEKLEELLSFWVQQITAAWHETS